MFLLVAFVKCILSQIIVLGTVLFDTFWRLWTLAFSRKYFQSLLTFSFFYLKTSKFRNFGLVGRRKLPNSLMKIIFDTLSISLQYTLLI